MIAMVGKVFNIIYVVFAASVITQMILCLIIGEMEITRQIMFVAARIELPLVIAMAVIKAIVLGVNKKKSENENSD